MSKIRIASRYATVPNELLNDNSISLKSKGMYAFIQSKPDNWEFSAEKISRLLKEGLPSVKSSLQELEENGYLSRGRYQNSKGFWEVEYILYENPKVLNPTAENLIAGNPPQENPTIGKPSNISNKEFKNKDNINNQFSKRDELFSKWFNYKKEKKQGYKQAGINQLYKTWEDHSDNNLEEAINHSISNNYNGLFEPKKQYNGNSNNEPKLGTSAARMEALKNW